MLQERSRTTNEIAPMEKAVLLLVDDDQLITESLSFILKKKYQVYIAESRPQAKDIISSLKTPPQLALVDLGLPPFPHQADEGFALIEDLLAHDPQMKILVLSGQSEEMNIQHALTLGAVDFVPKPADPALLQTRLQHHLMLQYVEKQRSQSITDSAIIGESAAMQVLRQQIEQFSTSLFPVLIEGESGTGKELIAKALHEESSRKDNAYMVINCAAISPNLLESQLFGYVKGAFTGANNDHKGFFAEAENGTLFLDEVGEIPYDVQAKLLRVLESGEYYRVGATECLKSNARIIAASNKSLANEVKEGKLRSDLFHRLSILKIIVPALREREKDSLLLRMHFQNLYEDSIKHFSLNEEANKLWIEYDYPGNVRELRNVVIRLGTKYPSRIITRDILENEFEIDVVKEKVESLKTGFSSGRFNDVWLMKEIGSGEFVLDEALNELENHCINLAMGMFDGNLSKVAKVLHINRSTLYSRIQKNIGKGEE
jgi:DNA-binding NtrC family response regulator